MSRAILVSGATGKQGGALVNTLIQENAPFEILALTRDATSASAQKLAKKSPKIKLVQGDLSNIDAVFAAAKEATSLPIWGVFSVQVCRSDSRRVPGTTSINTNRRVIIGCFWIEAGRC